MIDKNIMYGCHCDNCGENWIDEENGISVFGTENDVLNEVRNFESWHTEGPFGNEKHYCPECFKVTDEDELVIDMTRTKPLDWEPKNGVPRRMRLDLLTPNELLVYNIGQEVEKMGADVLLTDAVILLQHVREKLADYVEAKNAQLSEPKAD